MNRFKVLDDPKVKSLIKSKEELATKVASITEKITKLEEDRNKLVLKIQRYNDKALPLIKPFADESELEEFEEYTRVYFKDDELRLEIINNLEAYKVFLRKQKEEAKKKEDNKEDDGTESNNEDEAINR